MSLKARFESGLTAAEIEWLVDEHERMTARISELEAENFGFQSEIADSLDRELGLEERVEIAEKGLDAVRQFRKSVPAPSTTY